jgi:hypothetical protein
VIDIIQANIDRFKLLLTTEKSGLLDLIVGNFRLEASLRRPPRNGLQAGSAT